MGRKRKQPEFLVCLEIWDVRSSLDQTDSVIFLVCSRCVEWCNKQLRNCGYYFVLRMTNLLFFFFSKECASEWFVGWSLSILGIRWAFFHPMHWRSRITGTLLPTENNGAEIRYFSGLNFSRSAQQKWRWRLDIGLSTLTSEEFLLELQGTEQLFYGGTNTGTKSHPLGRLFTSLPWADWRNYIDQIIN